MVVSRKYFGFSDLRHQERCSWGADKRLMAWLEIVTHDKV
uniref:Uncharacterized protein n=1 Tax=Rhizophora mucronata TaxID=61149 RepID=A0A2P2Q0A4_RHIMU